MDEDNNDLKPTIKYSQILYNIDDNGDYLYIEYIDYGYVIYCTYTAEIIESNPQLYLDFLHEHEIIYYFGPFTYCVNNQNHYLNLYNDEIIYIADEDKENYISHLCDIKENINAENEDDRLSTYNAPTYDSTGLVVPNLKSYKLIDNAEYFQNMPTIGVNGGEDCGPIAAQLLLGYHNYYTDRRIISDKYLNGYDDETNSVIHPELNPNYCNNPDNMSSDILGTRSETDNHNSFFNLMKNYILDNYYYEGSLPEDIELGIKSYLIDNDYPGIYDIIEYTGAFPFAKTSKDILNNEIDSNRPFILGMLKLYGGLNHYVTAYGYGMHEYIDGSGTYFGYIVHFGKNTANYAYTWVNSSWCNSYITFDFDHEHLYDVDTGNVFNELQREVKCGICGHRTLVDIFTYENDTIVSVNTMLSGEIVIPSSIDGITIKKIGSGAFAGCDDIQEVIMPNTVTYIGNNAFSGCTSLKKITLSTSLETIGSLAFNACESLEEIDLPESVNNIEGSAFSWCTSLTDIIIPSKVSTIPSFCFAFAVNLNQVTANGTLDKIEDSAFINCSKLKTVSIEKNKTLIPIIGDSVFNNCVNLENIYVAETQFINYIFDEDWAEYKEHISCICFTCEYLIDCNTNLNTNPTLFQNKNLVFKLSVQCNTSYFISLNSIYNIDLTILDNNKNIIYINDNNNEYTEYEFNYNLNHGNYYINVSYADESMQGEINFSMLANSLECSVGVNNVIPHLHQNKSEGMLVPGFNFKTIFKPSHSGFYEIKVSAILNDGSIYEFNENEILVVSNPETTGAIYRYHIINNELAENENSVNEMLVYLETKAYYIKIILTRNDFISLDLQITNVENVHVNLFEYPTNFDGNLYSYTSQIYFSYDNLIRYDFDQSLKLSLNTTGFYTGKFIVVKEEAIDGIYTLTNIIVNDTMNNGYSKTFSLSSGTYYIGYINATMTDDYSCILKRVLTDFGDGFLVPDAVDAPIYGTEVTLNNGLYNSNEITQGFTRIINLYNKESRLNYHWYSSDDSVARVTDFGTVMALSVTVDTPVLIMAVNKEDPSKTYVKEFIIKVETKTFEDDPLIYNIDMTITVTNTVNSAQINLTNKNVPINWLQYYCWISSDDNITVNDYGIITVNQNAVGNTYQIMGAYRLNSRVVIYINVEVK